MKLLEGIPFEKYNNVDFVLDYIRSRAFIGNEDTQPIEYFHCFWKGTLSDLHFMCLESLYKLHPNSTIILWTPDALETQGSHAWIKVKRLLKEKIVVKNVTYDDFRECGIGQLFSMYSLLIQNRVEGYNHSIAYASDIIRFIVLYLYGGVWFDMDILFLRNLDSIKINRYVSQWGTDPCGNAAILKLEKGHDLIPSIIKQFQKPFYPTTTFKLENDIDLTILPSTFFDVHWQNIQYFTNWNGFKSWDDFFILEHIEFPKEIYGYHWHNKWNNKLPNFYLRQL